LIKQPKVRVIPMASYSSHSSANAFHRPGEPAVDQGDRLLSAARSEFAGADMSKRPASAPTPQHRGEHRSSLRQPSAAGLSVVVPMYNEADRIEKSLKTLVGSSLNRDDVQFIFVDDGSSDTTVETVARLVEASEFVRTPDIIALGRNHGKGAAVRTGMLHAGGSHVAFIDADLSLNPSVLDDFLQELIEERADVIVGYRIVNPLRQPRIRRLMSVTFTAITARLAPTGVRDTQCACKIFTAEAAAKVFQPLVTEGFAFDVEVLLRARAAKLKVVEKPVQWRHSDGSRVNQLIAPFIMMNDVMRVRRLIKSRP
jgi:Glycosyl transferase family 2